MSNDCLYFVQLNNFIRNNIKTISVGDVNIQIYIYIKQFPNHNYLKKQNNNIFMSISKYSRHLIDYILMITTNYLL